MTYRVSHYRQRATALVFDQEYTQKAVAYVAFQRLAAEHIADSDCCILLSRGETTLAAKSTDETRVELYPAYYRSK